MRPAPWVYRGLHLGMILVSLVTVEGAHGARPAREHDAARSQARRAEAHAPANRNRAPLRRRHVAPDGAGPLRAPSPELPVDELRDRVQHARHARARPASRARVRLPGKRGDAARFDPNTDPHHHAVCDECGTVLDIAAGTLAPTPGATKKLRRAAPGFSVRTVERIYRGLCSRCARQRSEYERRKRRTPWPSRFREPRPTEPQGGVRRRVAGEPPLPLFREGRRRRGLPRDRRQLQGDGRRRDRPRARSPRLPEAGRRPGDGPADRQHREEPQGLRRRRDLRVRDDVPGHGEVRARRGLRRHRRVVRDAREGREEPRGPLHEDARRSSRATLLGQSRRRAAEAHAREGSEIAESSWRLGGLRRPFLRSSRLPTRRRSRPILSCPS